MKKVRLFVGTFLVFFVLALCGFSVEAKAADMHRLYNPNSGEHFYTANTNEKTHLVKIGWKYEGIGWTAPEKGAAVYRMYNANAGDHHYTLNGAEKNHLVKVGWKYEGVGWYSDVNKTIPLYRAYNPNAKAGSHNYTVNYAEQQDLIRVGWRNEGIAWYGIKKTAPVTKYTVTVKHVGSDGKTLKTIKTSVDKGKSHTAKAESFSGYTLKGSNEQTVTVNGNKTITFNYTKNTVPVTKYKVTIKYIDTSEKEIAKAATASVEKGKSYTAKAISISGYTLKGNSSQTSVINGVKEIIFVYTKNPTPVTKCQVTIKYVGSDKRELKKTTVTVTKGQTYTAKAETFTGYTLSGKDSQTISAVNNDQTLTFNYNLNKYDVSVIHKGSDGKTLGTEKISVEYNKEYKANAKTFTGYTLSGKNTQTVIVKGVITITFIYNKNPDPVTKCVITIKHIGSDGRVLKTSTATVDKGKAYTANAESFTGYTLKGGKTQTISAVTKDQELRFDYTINKYTVTILHKDNYNKVLKTETATIEYNMPYTAKSASFSGYTLSGNATQTVTIQKDTTITFKYNLNKYTVTIYHKTIDGVILDTENITVEHGKNCTAQSKTYSDYYSEYSSQTAFNIVSNGRTLTFDYKKIVELPDAELQIMRETILNKVNELRISKGLNRLELDSKLTEAVNIRAEEQKQLASHTRPDGNAWSTVLTEVGVSHKGAGENIASRTSSVISGKTLGEAMYQQWYESQGHRDNMLGNYKYIGIGVSSKGRTVYGVQLFINR